MLELSPDWTPVKTRPPAINTTYVMAYWNDEFNAWFPVLFRFNAAHKEARFKGMMGSFKLPEYYINEPVSTAQIHKKID